VYIYTIPVLLDGHVQHTDKLAKSHISVSIKYGLNEFQFNKLFFSFYMYSYFVWYSFPGGMC